MNYRNQNFKAMLIGRFLLLGMLIAGVYFLSTII